MTKIDKLTPEQEAKFPEYVKEWTARGLTTTPQTQEQAEKDFTEFQRVVLKMDKPAPVVLLSSPDDCWREVCRRNADNDEEYKDLLKDPVYPYFDCQFWAGWAAFYEYARVELGVSYDNMNEYQSLLACIKYGMVWPTERVCVVCQPPSVIKVGPRGLHCEDGPAVSYNGKFEIYALNGVRVPKELVMTPSEELSVEWFTKQSNADVKAEFVRKFGVERMLEMGKLVDSYTKYPAAEGYEWWHKSKYELWDMAVLFEGLEYQPYLKMVNQTTGIFHVEAVSPECRTVPEALRERFGGRDMTIAAIA